MTYGEKQQLMERASRHLIQAKNLVEQACGREEPLFPQILEALDEAYGVCTGLDIMAAHERSLKSKLKNMRVKAAL